MAEKRSSMKNKREQQRKKAAKARRVRRTLLVITEFLLVCALSICCYAVSILNTMQRSTINQKEIYVATFANNGDNDQQEAQPATTEPQSKEQEKESEKSGEQESVPESSSAKPGSVINVSEVTQATTVDDILSHQETVNGYWNILLVGVDARDQANLGGGNGVQSDVMMICSINVKTKEVKLVSIYRDTLLKMYSRDEFDLANSEFAKGSDTDMISMINMNLDLQIQDVVVVNWAALIRVIDAIGGIYLDITPEEVEKGYITGYITEIEEATGIWQPQLTQAGYQLCNGVYAVAYCRNRYTTGMDMGRTSRQREVIDKMLQQAKVASPSALLTAVRYACPNINTTLSNDELFALAADVNSYSITDTEGFPYTYDLTLGTLGVFGVKDSLVCTDLAGDVKKLHTYLFGDDGYEPSQTVKDISYTIQKAFGVGQKRYKVKKPCISQICGIWGFFSRMLKEKYTI